MDEFIVGLRLMKVRQHRGLTQEQVAEKAQLNLKDYIAMEEGKMLENKERLEKACKALDIKIDDLFDSQTFINYGENNGMGCGLHNNNTFNQRSDDDITFMSNMLDSLKHVSEHLDLINTTIKSLSEHLDDTVFKKRLIEAIKDYEKEKKRKREQ